MFSEEARRTYIRRAPAIAGVLLLASCFGLIPHAVTAQQQQMLLSGHVNYSHTSPPTSGVKLLEDIFAKVRSAPQIAMARNLMKQQQIASADQAQMIRPKKLTGRALPSPSLNIIASAPSLSEAFAGGGSDGDSSLARQSAAEPQMILGSRTLPLQTASNKTNQNGMWESQGQQMADAISAAQSQKPQQVPDLKTATGRFFGLMNGLQNAQNMGNALRDQRSTIAQNFPQSNMGRFAAPQEEVTQTAFKGSSNEGYAGADAEFAKDKSSNTNAKARRESKSIAALPPPLPAAAPLPAKKAKPGSMGAYGGGAALGTAVGALAGGKLDAAKEKDEAPASRADEKRAKIAMNSADIALLPPNVVTGIPLVHLGSSEQTASGALQSIGSMKQQKVQKWTVWSWSRPQTKNGTSLQLYMRNGLLDAMRIFDPSLIGPDFGVNVGDSMSRVKEKFGEPAFIVDEPQPGAGRNYVYPISQIGFQLARPAPGDQPRVVSVLIFNVK